MQDISHDILHDIRQMQSREGILDFALLDNDRYGREGQIPQPKSNYFSLQSEGYAQPR